ncbi:MAG: flagellar hook-basal body protein, partial [Nitrospinales bacterium]
SGGMKQQKKLNIISNNLANLSNHGFKKDALVFEALVPPFKQTGGLEEARNILLPAQNSNAGVAYVAVTGFNTDYSQGGLSQTNGELDLALNGNGFFKVKAPQGIRYTRKGSFRLGENKFLVTQEGYRVLDEEGNPIAINAQGKKITVDTLGKISAGLGLQNIPLGKMKIVSFSKNSMLMKEGNGLFRLTDSKIKEELASDVTVRQGFLETSNVNNLEEMAQMMSTMRAFEAYQKVIQTIDGLNDQAANNLGRIG